METQTIIIVVIMIIILLLLYVAYVQFKPYIEKNMILNTLENFNNGNLILFDENHKQSLTVINDKNKTIPRVHVYDDNSFFSNVLYKSDLGLGECYMRGEWYTDNLVEFLNTLALNMNNSSIPSFSYYNFFSHDTSYDKKNIQHHYDVGNDFYLKFLTDDLSAYSCGIWLNENDTLNDAQYNKVNTIIYKMSPVFLLDKQFNNSEQESNKKILDIGCGWGKIANYVSQKTNCHVTGITISNEQVKYALDNYDPNRVLIKNMDYRLLNQKFDYIYSIGMFEHVRYENYDTFFQTIKRCLNPNGRFALHTIISLNKSDPKYVRESFISKHIFPGGQIPTNDWITDAILRNGLNTVHFEGFGGQHYAKTLKIWRENMLKEKDYIIMHYGEELFKKYEFYFAICEAGFNAGFLAIGHYVIVNNDIVSLNNSFNYALNIK